jgi:hypothetical protein
MYYYSAYGLTIGSALLLPELQPTATLAVSAQQRAPADIQISFGAIPWTPNCSLDDSETWDHFQVNGQDEAYLYWRIVGKFWVRSGREIIIDPIPEVTEKVMRLPLLGAVLAMVLHQRKLLVLHASAIAIGNGAAVFLGRKGQGKSTMAATLFGRGHRLLTDDVTAVDLRHPEQPMILPGFPQIKLWPEAAVAALGDDPSDLARVHPEAEKRARPTAENFLQVPLPLRRLYILTHEEAISSSYPQGVAIQPLNPAQALVQLIANSYIPSLLGNQFLQTTDAPAHLQQCAQLTALVRSLSRPRSLALLPDVAQRVEADLSNSVLQPQAIATR